MAVLFISAAKVKELSSIHGNVDDKYITPIINECQDLYIEPIIGTGLYNEIKGQLPSSLSVLNATLLNTYIIPCLVAYIKYEAVTDLNFKFTNKNVGKKSSDNSQPIDSNDSIFFMNELKNKAEFRAERITKYLLQNSTSYPLFLNAGNGLDTIHPNGTNYDCGIVLDDLPNWCNGCGNYKNSCLCYIYK